MDFQTLHDWLAQNTPFFIGASGITPKLSVTRVIESVVIAALTAALTFGLFLWQALPVIETRLGAIERQLDRIDQRDNMQDQKLYEHEGRIDLKHK